MIEFLSNDRAFYIHFLERFSDVEKDVKAEVDSARFTIIKTLEMFIEGLEKFDKGLAFKEWRYFEKHFIESRLSVYWYEKMKEAKMRDIYIKIAILLCTYSGYLQDFRKDLENLENLSSERKKQIRTRIYKWIKRFKERPKSAVLPDFITKEIEDRTWEMYKDRIERTVEQFKDVTGRKSKMGKEAKRGEKKE